MIKNRIGRILVLLLIVVCTSLGFTSCQINGNIIGLSDYYYEDSEKYLMGEAELTEPVENIDINWMVGNVTVQPHNLDTVSFSEESEGELTEDMRLRYWLEDKTLRIKFCKCGKWDFSELEKNFTLLVPVNMIIDNLKVSSFSANINLTNCSVSQSAKINTLSGNLKAEFLEPLNEFKGNSTSGTFTVSAPTISKFDVGTVSSEVSLSVQKEPEKLDVDTTSGNINLVLPKSASFTLDYDSTSGDMLSDFSYRMSSKKYIFGDGKGEYKISTVSGDVRVQEAK